MNFSVNKLNDASVLAALECNTPIYQGLVLYPLPFMGEEDASTVKLIKDTFQPRTPRDDDDDFDFEIKDYHVIFNMTPYADTVVSLFIKVSQKTRNGLLMLSCNSDVLDYMASVVPLGAYRVMQPNDEVRSVFETIEPMKIAKYSRLLRAIL